MEAIIKADKIDSLTYFCALRLEGVYEFHLPDFLQAIGSPVEVPYEPLRELRKVFFEGLTTPPDEDTAYFDAICEQELLALLNRRALIPPIDTNKRTAVEKGFHPLKDFNPVLLTPQEKHHFLDAVVEWFFTRLRAIQAFARDFYSLLKLPIDHFGAWDMAFREKMSPLLYSQKCRDHAIEHLEHSYVKKMLFTLHPLQPAPSFFSILMMTKGIGSLGYIATALTS